MIIQDQIDFPLRSANMAMFFLKNSMQHVSFTSNYTTLYLIKVETRKPTDKKSGNTIEIDSITMFYP